MDNTNEAKAVRQIEAILNAARADGCNVCRIVTQVCANHLFSDESDDCHINGIEFGAQINEHAINNSKNA